MWKPMQPRWLTPSPPLANMGNTSGHLSHFEGFVGRSSELAVLDAALARAAAGRGGIVMLVGEAGIGKTRTAAELAAHAGRSTAAILRGGCHEGEWAPPYGPIIEALTAYVRATDPLQLREELGLGASILTSVLPALRERLPALAEPPVLESDEERFRLFDAVSQFLVAISKASPVVLLLDDLHWADRGTIALLRHLARVANEHRLLLIGAYRDAEVHSAHPLLQLIAALRREARYQRLLLKGLDDLETRVLITALAQRGVAPDLATGVHGYTGGNPFFIREVVQHLIDDGKLSDTKSKVLQQLPLPEGIRFVIERRLARLSTDANRFLAVAAACDEPFRHDVVSAVAALGPAQGLMAAEEALGGRLICAFREGYGYEFSHALIRQTIYTGLSPARRIQLHRQLAEAFEKFARPGEYASEIAQHFFRSKDLPGAERGAPYAIAAATHAAARHAYDSEAEFLRLAFALSSDGDPGRAEVLARRGLALVGASRFDEAAAVALEAAAMFAEKTGSASAADYLAEVARSLDRGGGGAFIPPLAYEGLNYVGARRDVTWAELKIYDIVEHENNVTEGIPLDTPDRRAIAEVLARMPLDMSAANATTFVSHFRRLTSRKEILARDPLAACVFEVGDYRSGILLMRDLLRRVKGRVGLQVGWWSGIAHFQVALGEFSQAREALGAAINLAERLAVPAHYAPQLAAAEDELRLAMDDNWGAPMEAMRPGWDSGWIYPWYRYSTLAAVARTLAHVGRLDSALRRLPPVVRAMESAPGWAQGYTRIACDTAATLWLCRRTDSIDAIERNLREKVIEPDFHYPMRDGRLALARLSALQERYDEAAEWFAKARSVLVEQGARPLVAIADYDEALMYTRRGAAGDRAIASPLLNKALERFRAIGMPGWVRRAEHLQETGEEWAPPSPPEVPAPPPPPAPVLDIGESTGVCVVRCEGDVWAISVAGTKWPQCERETVVRLKRSKGLQYLWYLVSHPGVEFLALDLVARTRNAGEPSAEASVSSAGLDILDGSSKAAYRQRLLELRETLAEAEGANDSGSAERARAEIQFIEDELVAATGLGGRYRTRGSSAERARSTVTKGVKAAIAKITVAHPTLGRHLDRTVRTGVYCSYAPAPDERVHWQL